MESRMKMSSISCIVSLVACFPVLSVAFFAPVTSGIRQSRIATTSLDMSAALIVQNKGGGHGELGYQLAKNLQANHNEKITSITILQDNSCDFSKEPFASYEADLPNVNVVQAPLGDDDMTSEQLQDLLGADTRFDYVWDNASKKPEGAGKAVLECSKQWAPKLHVYVSSAGMYTPEPDGPFPMTESTPIKPTAGQNLYDQYAVEQGLPLVSFRPQYIYGPKANKYSYLDWYFDRLVRELPLPIPGDGTQLVSLTNSEDVASILASPLNQPEAAVEQRFFNCGTDELVSYADLAMFCAEAAGIPTDTVKLVYYDANKLGKAQFPFRPANFYVTPDLVKEKLGWKRSHNLVDDLKEYYESYKARGGLDKKLSLVQDWEIVVGQYTPSSPEKVASLYEKWDPIPLDTSSAATE